MKVKQRKDSEAFLALHKAPPLLILPNAWDVASAKIFEIEGFKAIGTTSAGISAALGYPDGQKMSLEENLSVVRRIVDHIDLPISVDIESGYSDTPEGVAMSAEAVLKTGAVGLNLEDSTGDLSKPLYDVSFMAEKLKAIREMSSSEDIHLVVNARTDTFLVDNLKLRNRIQQTVSRANAYSDAGADCIFVPDVGGLDIDTISLLIKEINSPLNIIVGAQSPPLAKLEEIGVARVSLGPRPMRATLGFLRKIAKELLEKGTYDHMTKDALSYSEVNRWFENDLI
ncbi:MAG: isocitrate lyase/phosphoenolpyruvate mutase family protein [Candidatus Aminicenantes bacterium]|nr:MAG: isocitrate lyase/phosphoenolpyruvate mutase family protein [Candidatus Aminicenantes bacterium]